MKRSILFVCTGNICRSPMSAALFAAEATKHGDAEQYLSSSAGTWALENEPATGNAQIAMEKLGLSLAGHRARTVDEELLGNADLVLVMTRHHQEALAAEFPWSRAKMHLMSELGEQHYDIGDPYGSPLEDYQMCAAELSSLINQGYGRIQVWLELPTVQGDRPRK